MKLPLKFLCEDRDRQGNVRMYVRRHSRKIRIRARWGTPEFIDAYHAALAATERPVITSGKSLVIPLGSLRWLTVRYYSSAEFKGLNPSTQRVRRGIMVATTVRLCKYSSAGEPKREAPRKRLCRNEPYWDHYLIIGVARGGVLADATGFNLERLAS